MYNFEYKNPVKIIFGKNTIPAIKSEIPENATVLMCYGGGSIKANGVYNQVKEALQSFKHFEFGGIEPNPLYETCMKAVELAKKEKVDFLLAVGGGSVLDAVKFIAAAMHFSEGDPWNILAKKAAVNSALPIGTILTLPATGSEMNGNSVISRFSTQEKFAFGSPKVLPVFSVLDPQCVFTLPDRQIANGIVDAFVHVMEQYLTFPVNSPIQDRFAESILLTLMEEGPKVLANQHDYEAAANFMWSATVALNGLIGAGVPQDWSTHVIGHELTAFHGIDHARTLAVVLPGVMDKKRDNKKEKLLQYASRIWGISEGAENDRINAAIEKTVAFFESVGIKTRLSDYHVGEETIEKIAKRFETRRFKPGERADMTPAQIAEILKSRL